MSNPTSPLQSRALPRLAERKSTLMASYGPLRPVVYRAMCARLEEGFDIIASDGLPGSGCQCLRQMRMGLGTSKYYNIAYDGPDGIVPEPMLAGVLDYFEIPHWEFMAGLVGEAV